MRRAADRRFYAALAASVALSLPVVMKGTPDVEGYSMSAFSTIAFARNLVHGVDPWFVPAYGFGIPLPTSSWFVKFPPALLAALFGIRALYATLWLTGTFLFSLYFLKLSEAFTPSRWVSAVLLGTALLSFSNLGTTYVDDWPEHFLGWALFPACLWFVIRTIQGRSTRDLIAAGAACIVVLGITVGSVEQNEMATIYAALALFLVAMAPTRARGVIAVGIAMIVATAAALDVIVPTVQGMWQGGVNPAHPQTVVYDALTIRSYRLFLQPVWNALVYGPRSIAQSAYERAPFFGLPAFVLAVLGAARAFRSSTAIHAAPNDVARGTAVAFAALSILTILPPWIVRNLPRTWMFRDGQTVFGLLCAAAGLDWIGRRAPRLVLPVLVVQGLQVVLVAAPIVRTVLVQDRDTLFGYARQDHVLFDGLRRAGIDNESRVLLAGRLEHAVRAQLGSAGVTATTDFPLEGIAVVNAWYRGGLTPALGAAMAPGRYGAYETQISWEEADVRYLTRSGLAVLGITHVAAFEDDRDAIAWAEGLTPLPGIALPDGRRVSVFRNDAAWSRVALLRPGPPPTPARRPECPTSSVFCRDYDALSRQLQTRLQSHWSGSSVRLTLPDGHAGGTLFVSEVIGPTPTATVDGRARDVRPFLDTFGTLDVQPGERTVVLSVRQTTRVYLTLLGVVALAGSFLTAVALGTIRPAA